MTALIACVFASPVAKADIGFDDSRDEAIGLIDDTVELLDSIHDEASSLALAASSAYDYDSYDRLYQFANDANGMSFFAWQSYARTLEGNQPLSNVSIQYGNDLGRRSAMRRSFAAIRLPSQQLIDLYNEYIDADTRLQTLLGRGPDSNAGDLAQTARAIALADQGGQALREIQRQAGFLGGGASSIGDMTGWERYTALGNAANSAAFFGYEDFLRQLQSGTRPSNIAAAYSNNTSRFSALRTAVVRLRQPPQSILDAYAHFQQIDRDFRALLSTPASAPISIVSGRGMR